MEFLEKLYSQEYFAPVLFTVIAILAVLFIIVLILALRDAKKRKNIEGNGSTDTFAQTNEQPQEISINIAPSSTEVKAEIPTVNVISSVDPTTNSFQNIEVPAPIVENNETPIVAAPTEEIVQPVAPVEEPQDIKIESAPSVSADVNSSNDLDAIASTLLSEYQKDKEVSEKVETPAPEVATNPLPVEEKKEIDLPSLNDIPVPQPVKVTETQTVIDSSKQSVDSIQTEEYNINK